MSSAGVCAPDGHELSCWQTGLWGAFLRQLELEEPTGLDHNWVSCFGYRPQTAEQILQGWVAAEPKLEWRANCKLEQVHCRQGHIHSVQILKADGVETVAAEVFIDGSDLGDLLASLRPLSVGVGKPRSSGMNPAHLSNQGLRRRRSSNANRFSHRRGS